MNMMESINQQVSSIANADITKNPEITLECISKIRQTLVIIERAARDKGSDKVIIYSKLCDLGFGNELVVSSWPELTDTFQRVARFEIEPKSTVLISRLLVDRMATLPFAKMEITVSLRSLRSQKTSAILIDYTWTFKDSGTGGTDVTLYFDGENWTD